MQNCIFSAVLDTKLPFLISFFTLVAFILKETDIEQIRGCKVCSGAKKIRARYPGYL